MTKTEVPNVGRCFTFAFSVAKRSGVSQRVDMITLFESSKKTLPKMRIALTNWRNAARVDIRPLGVTLRAKLFMALMVPTL